MTVTLERLLNEKLQRIVKVEKTSDSHIVLVCPYMSCDLLIDRVTVIRNMSPMAP